MNDRMCCVSERTALSCWSRADSSATCSLACVWSLLSRSSLSFILFNMAIMSSFSLFLASHSLSFFSKRCCKFWCSGEKKTWLIGGVNQSFIPDGRAAWIDPEPKSYGYFLHLHLFTKNLVVLHINLQWLWDQIYIQNDSEFRQAIHFPLWYRRMQGSSVCPHTLLRVCTCEPVE